MTVITSEKPVAVVGATGRTGRLIVARLLERGTSVRAVIRDAGRLAGQMVSSRSLCRELGLLPGWPPPRTST